MRPKRECTPCYARLLRCIWNERATIFGRTLASNNVSPICMQRFVHEL